VTLDELIAKRRVLVCAGPGGAGKTTTAAALAVRAAARGRPTLVCTIDPAPRLEDALGLRGLGGRPAPVTGDAARSLGLPEGATLRAARLDTAAAFARLVEAEVQDPAARRRILENQIYRQITTALTGSQEYAALLALHDLHVSGGNDLLVLDTPPTAHALDFLEAPRRITEATASPLLRWLTAPSKRSKDGKEGLFAWSKLRTGGALVLQRLGKLAGSKFLDDMSAFLTDFQPVLQGFSARATTVAQLLRAESTGFVIVLAPEVPAVNEALAFAGQVRAAGVRLDALIASRVLPPISLVPTYDLVGALDREPALADLTPQERGDAATALGASAAHATRVGAAQRREIQRLQRGAGDVPILEVPRMVPDESGLATIRRIGEHLGASAL
jgi:anion-transporting  ArsA/GET3 family ATPase